MAFGRPTGATHTANGELAAEEMHRRHQTFLDQQPMITRCAVDGCGWLFDGATVDALAAARAHRDTAHPSATARRLSQLERQRLHQEAAAVRAAELAAREAEEDTAVGEAPVTPATAGPSPTGEPPVCRGRPPAFTRERIIAAIKAHHAEHETLPGSDAWRYKDPSGKRPTVDNVKTQFGSWSAGIAAAGFTPRAFGDNQPSRSEPKGPAALTAERELTANPQPTPDGEAPAAAGPVPVASPAPATTDTSVAEGGSHLEHLADAIGDEVAFLRRRADALEAVASGLRNLAAA